MKLPLTTRTTTTGAVAIYDADNSKVATIRTDSMVAPIAINAQNANLIKRACESHDELIAVLQTAHMALTGYIHQNDVTKNAIAKCVDVLTKLGVYK